MGLSSNILSLIAVFLGGLIIGLFLSNYVDVPTLNQIKLPLVTEKIVTKNPEFYPDDRSWQGNYRYYGEPISSDSKSKDGLVIIHPVDIQTPTYVFQEVKLEEGKKYLLKARVANIAKYSFSSATGCDDSIIIIKLTDTKTGNDTELFNEVLNTEQGWKTISIDVSNFSGKNVILQAEGHAGGPCGKWSGEWSAVDYLYIEEK